MSSWIVSPRRGENKTSLKTQPRYSAMYPASSWILRISQLLLQNQRSYLLLCSYSFHWSCWKKIDESRILFEQETYTEAFRQLSSSRTSWIQAYMVHNKTSWVGEKLPGPQEFLGCPRYKIFPYGNSTPTLLVESLLCFLSVSTSEFRKECIT